MKKLLVINSSGRSTRSITRNLTSRFAAKWTREARKARVIERDVGLRPPPTVNEAWIAAAFANGDSTSVQRSLAQSEELIEELVQADVVVFGAPMYNFGMPAQLKAYFDQVVRVGRTFAFDPEAEEPYQPLLENKPVVIITSVGDGAILPGGPLFHMNHLEPHLETVLGFVGLTDLRFIRVGYDEYQDERLQHSRVRAEEDVDQLALDLARDGVPLVVTKD